MIESLSDSAGSADSTSPAGSSEKADADQFLIESVELFKYSRSIEHPFLKFLLTRRLEVSEVQLFFSEIYYWFRYLPFYIAGIASLTRDQHVLREIIRNIADEVGGLNPSEPISRSHSDIFHDFLSILGIDRKRLNFFVPNPETEALNNGVRSLYSEPPLARALGALLYDETMSEIMVSKINDVLAFNGFDLKDRYFWVMHIDAEREHKSAALLAARSYVLHDADRVSFMDGMSQMSILVERFWDALAARMGYGSMCN